MSLIIVDIILQADEILSHFHRIVKRMKLNDQVPRTFVSVKITIGMEFDIRPTRMSDLSVS